MGKFYETIPESIYPWLLDQKAFWVATAPLSPSGHVNLSPKGGQHFGLIDERTFWYIDLTGSGVETVSHLYEPGNGRITVLFSGFEGAPRIVRLWGRGSVLEYGTPAFENFVLRNSVGTSCGYSVPFYDFVGYRDTLNNFLEKRVANDEAGKKDQGIERYWAFKNAESMDKLPGLKRGIRNAKADDVAPFEKMTGDAARRGSLHEPKQHAIEMIWAVLLSFVLGLLVARHSSYIYQYVPVMI